MATSRGGRVFDRLETERAFARLLEGAGAACGAVRGGGVGGGAEPFHSLRVGEVDAGVGREGRVRDSGEGRGGGRCLIGGVVVGEEERVVTT